MTQRPIKRELPDAVGENFRRTRNLERLHHGPWIYVGSGELLPDGLTSPEFQNNWENVGGDLQELRFRWLRNGGVEIQGSITGGIVGTTIFTLPADSLYVAGGGELRFTALNDTDGLVGMAILANGEVQHRAETSAGIEFGSQLTGDCLDIETTGDCAEATTPWSSYSALGMALNDVGDGGIVIGSTGNINIDGEGIGIHSQTQNIDVNAVCMFFNTQVGCGYFFSGGYALWSTNGFEVDSDNGLYFSNSSDTQLTAIENFGDTGIFLGTYGGGQVELGAFGTGTIDFRIGATNQLVMQIRADGSIHIRSGTAIIADLP